jgi:hypothetical protein
MHKVFAWYWTGVRSGAGSPAFGSATKTQNAAQDDIRRGRWTRIQTPSRHSAQRDSALQHRFSRGD